MLLSVLLLVGCGSKIEHQELTSAQAKDKMNEDVVLLDVRTTEEFASGHIEKAINIPVENITEIKSQVSDENAVILVYCRSGNRSAKASTQLVEMGYTEVYDFGGIQDWPYEIVK